jgi:hypothetical protein
MVDGVAGMPANGETPLVGVELLPVPYELIAATLKMYTSPLVKPVTTQLVAVLVSEEGQTFAVESDVDRLDSPTTYPVLALPGTGV